MEMYNNRNNSKIKRVEIANETLKIIEAGYYNDSKGMTVNIKDELEFSIKNSVLYKPDMGEIINQKLEEKSKQNQNKTNPIIEVTNETTLHAARRLVEDEGYRNAVCLNFASAKHPGGGFLSGSQAQEESLARASVLYPCIVQMNEMYNTNMKTKTCLYTDYMIYSPEVLVFRDDKDNLIDKPYKVSFITAPAVNAGIIKERELQNIKLIESTMMERIGRILSLGVIHDNEAIVLGAYGCGVFKNDPDCVAEYFRKYLKDDERFIKAYKKIIFAVLDKSNSQEIFNSFNTRLIN